MPLLGAILRPSSGSFAQTPWDDLVERTTLGVVALLCSNDARWLTGQRLEATDVAITYERSAERAAELVRKIQGTGRRALVIQADSADPASVKRSVDGQWKG